MEGAALAFLVAQHTGHLPGHASGSHLPQECLSWWPAAPDLLLSVPSIVQVVDSQLVCMMNENSIDYISRFNDLAQELAITEPGRREALFDGSGGPPVGDLSQ